MKLLLLEDLDNYADVIREALESCKSQLGPVVIERVSTELEFRRRLPELINSSFDAAIFDVMVCWCGIEDLDTPDGANPPSEVLEETSGKTKWRAGLRCKRLFLDALAGANLPAVPCVFYTILERTDLEDNLQGDETLIVAKQGDIQPLVQALQSLTKHNKR